MAIIEIYKKKGNIPLKEKKMVAQIRAKVEQLRETNPEFTFNPAESPSELEKLYHKICSDEVEFEDVKDKSSSDEFKEKTTEMKETPTPEKSTEEPITESFKEKKSLGEFDPFSAEEVKVRHYVLEEEFQNINTNESGASINDFSEPTTFKESFEIPAYAENDDLTDIDEDMESQQGKPSEPSGSHTNHQSSHQAPPPPRHEAQPHMNPSYDNMDGAKQKRKTKRFAKQIVALTCDLMEKGFEWYATKNISESKLTQYELDNEMDLSLLVEMPNGQQATVKNFFLSQHAVIRDASIIPDEDREDLTDALTEVLIEKGIAPTPAQELMLTTARVIGLQVIKLVAITSSNNAILNQLRGFKKEETAHEEQVYQAPPPPMEKHEEPKAETVTPEPKAKEKVKTPKKAVEVNDIETVPFSEVPTKE